MQFKIVRRYWTGGRPSGCKFHRDIYLHRADGYVVDIAERFGGYHVFAASTVPRAKRVFPTMRAALGYAVDLASNGPADLWMRGAKARKAQAEWVA